MDIRKVKKLIELLEESGVSEIEIKEGEESVRISRHPTGTMHTIATPMAYSTPRRRDWRGRRCRGRSVGRRRPPPPRPRRLPTRS